MSSSNTTGVTLSRRQLLQSGAAAGGAVLVGGQPVTAINWDEIQTDVKHFAAVGAAMPVAPGLASGVAAWDLVNDSRDWVQGDAPDDTTDAEYVGQAGAWGARRYHNSVVREMALSTQLVDAKMNGFCGFFQKGKMAAIESVNAEKTKSQVKTDAINAAKERAAKYEASLIRAGNAGIRTLEAYYSVAQAEGTRDSMFTYHTHDSGIPVVSSWGYDQIDLLDGRTIDYRHFTTGPPPSVSGDWTSNGITVAGINARSFVDVAYGMGDPNVSNAEANASSLSILDNGNAYPVLPIKALCAPPQIQPSYLHGSTLQSAYDHLHNEWSTLESNIETYVDNIYQDLRVGEVQPGELTTACDLSRTVAENETNNLALVALRTSGIDYQGDHPTEIETTTTGGKTVTATGTLAATSNSVTVQENTQYDPPNDNFSWIFNYNTGNVAIEADGMLHQEGTDGGMVYWDKHPKDDDIERWTGDDYVIQIESGDGETAQLSRDDWTAVSGESWSFKTDISGLVNDSLTTIDNVTVYSNIDQNSTLYLRRNFTVKSIEGTNELSYSNDQQVHTVDNYVSGDEWEQREEDVEDVAESLPDDGDGGGPGLGGILPKFGGDWKKWAIIGGGGLLLYGFVTGS